MVEELRIDIATTALSYSSRNVYNLNKDDDKLLIELMRINFRNLQKKELDFYLK